MIPSIACLLLPFAGQCPQLVTNVPALAQVVQHRTRYTGKPISVTGRVRKLDQWTSKLNAPEELFSICEDACIRVYMRAHSPIREGERITVRGTYYAVLRIGSKTYHNELEGAEVLPRE